MCIISFTLSKSCLLYPFWHMRKLRFRENGLSQVLKDNKNLFWSSDLVTHVQLTLQSFANKENISLFITPMLYSDVLGPLTSFLRQLNYGHNAWDLRVSVT